jgi:NADH dehydrogenase
MSLNRIIILGGGFGGVAAVRALKGCDAEVLLLDRRNHHIFQPLLYQVATAVLAPSEVAAPLRQLAQEQPNLSVMMGEVTGVDLAAKIVRLKAPGLPERRLAFDYLVVATGARPSYFGHDEFAAYAPSLKTLADAEAIRARVLSAYELAEQTDDLEERSRALTFVLVGGGATGVELAASIAQMARITLRRNFRRIDAADTTILLLEGGKRILANFDESLSHKATRRLEKLGVTVRTGVVVEVVDERGVFASGERIESATVLWTAGVQASPIVKMLNTTTDRAGRACVGPFFLWQITRTYSWWGTLPRSFRQIGHYRALHRWRSSKVATSANGSQEKFGSAGQIQNPLSISTEATWPWLERILPSWSAAASAQAASQPGSSGRSFT